MATASNPMVYVDCLKPCLPNRHWRWTQSAHLIADTLEELHRFAASLGLKRAWFQDQRLPHYDLTPGRYQQALRRGAKLLSNREFVAKAKTLQQPPATMKYDIYISKDRHFDQFEVTADNDTAARETFAEGYQRAFNGPPPLDYLFIPRNPPAQKLRDALADLLRVIAVDALLPESVSYMQEARAALAAFDAAMATPPDTSTFNIMGQQPLGERSVTPLEFFGRQENGSWIFGDCAISPDGVLTPEGGTIGMAFPPPPALLGDLEPGLLSLARLTDILADTMGVEAAQSCIGLLAAYAARQELLDAFGGFPGLWLFGKMAAGKTTLARLLLSIWGVPSSGYASTQHSTSTGIERSLRRYSSLPLLLDDWRNGNHATEATVRGCYDQSPSTKLIVTGETASDDAATRSRFFHVEITYNQKRKRVPLPNRRFNSIGRELLMHRKRFLHLLLEAMRSRPQSETRQDYVLALGPASYQAAQLTLTPE